MKKLLYMAVAAIAVLSSCDKNDALLDGNGNGVDNADAPVFTATIEPETKTSLGLNSETGKYTKVNWLDTDEVSVNGIVYTVAPGASDPTTATLTKKNSTDESPVSPFKAIYPASLYNNGTYELPATQTYTAGKFNMPMYAENSETSLAFKNICSVLAITVPSTQMTSVKSITVSSDKQMNGVFTASAEGILTFATEGVTLTDANKMVTLDCRNASGANTSIIEGSSTTFYVPVPAMTGATLAIYVSDGTNTKVMNTKTAAVAVERSKIYGIEFNSSLFAVRFTAKQADSSVGIKKTDSGKADIVFQYSTDNGTTWTDYTPTDAGTPVTLTNIGDEICFRRKDNRGTALEGFSFTGSGDIAVSGNIMSLLSNDGSVVTLPAQYAFHYLFENNQALTDASQLSLPAATLEYGCYDAMFCGCEKLISAPALPATTLDGRCYQHMFQGCSSLTSAPELPATTLKNGCYSNMFFGCSNLTSAPVLPATTLKNGCYDCMFQDCENLTSAPELPATTLVKDCYKCMFGGCYKLESVKIYAKDVEDGVTITDALYHWFNIEVEERDRAAGKSLIDEGRTPIIHVTQALFNQFTSLDIDYYNVVWAGSGSYSTIPDGWKVIGINLLPGEYSSYDGGSMQFTKGNLFWDGSNYHFESHQYDFPTSWVANHVGYFYWTNMSDYELGTAAYMPYAETYSYSTQSTDDGFFCGGGERGGFLTVEGTGNLSTFSKEDWRYILGLSEQSRANANSLYKTGVNVAGKNCLVIAPDNYDYITKPLKKSYTADEWAATEVDGLVCLPYINMREGSGFLNYCGYWTSTPSSNNVAAYSVSNASLSESSRSLGMPIRLVRRY